MDGWYSRVGRLEATGPVETDGLLPMVAGGTPCQQQPGSHLGPPPETEMKLTVIWLADVTGGRLSQCQVLGDTPQRRVDLSIPTSA